VGGEYSSEFGDRHINARNVHKDHVCQDEIEAAVRQWQTFRQIGYPVFDGPTRVAHRERDHFI
jgi:hypothetical protein